jgi:hypothetical protein
MLLFVGLLDAVCERSTALFFNAFAGEIQSSTATERLHPKYKLPARCFAYIGNEADTKTWKLPYLLADGRPDFQRLPAAIQAVITSYRGKKVSGIPDDQIPDVLVRLGKAAARGEKMPFQNEKAAAIYRQLQTTLDKLDRLDEIKREKLENVR